MPYEPCNLLFRFELLEVVNVKKVKTNNTSLSKLLFTMIDLYANPMVRSRVHGGTPSPQPIALIVVDQLLVCLFSIGGSSFKFIYFVILYSVMNISTKF